MKILIICNYLLILLVSCSSSNTNKNDSLSEVKELESLIDLSHFERNLDSVELGRKNNCFYKNNKMYLEIDISDNPLGDENLTKIFFSYNLASSIKEENISLLDSVIMNIIYGKKPLENYLYTANNSEVIALINEFKANQKLYKTTQFIILNRFFLELEDINIIIKEIEYFSKYNDFFELLNNVYQNCENQTTLDKDILVLIAWIGLGKNDNMLEIMNYCISFCKFNPFNYEKLETIMEQYFQEKIKVEFEDSPKARFLDNSGG